MTSLFPLVRKGTARVFWRRCDALVTHGNERLRCTLDDGHEGQHTDGFSLVWDEARAE